MPRNRISLAFVLAFSACDSAPPAPAVVPPAVAPPAMDPLTPLAPRPPVPPLTDVPFRFVTAPPTTMLGAALDAVGPLAETHIIGDERAYHVARDGGVVRVVRRTSAGAEVWSIELANDATGAPVIGVEPFSGLLLVAVATARGATVYSIDGSDGHTRSETVVVPAPLDGAEIQLAATDAHGVIAYVRTEQRAWVARVDVDRAVVLARSEVPIELARVAIDPPANATRASATQGAYRVRTRGEVSSIALVGEDGTERWSHALPDALGCRLAAAIAEAGELTAVASYCPGMSGTTVEILDAQTGEAHARVSPFGIGSIGHSGYSNEVRVVVDGDRLRVYGNESGGRYVSTIDLRAARELSCITVRR